MSEWMPIETWKENDLNDVMLWNGFRVFPGWFDDGEGWRDARNQDYHDYPEVPQPTHWMPFPKPPQEAKP